jgi:uncharacterized protein with NRDE domain
VCTLALYRRAWPDWPLVVAANRDEFYARPASGPAPLSDVAGVVAGRDLEAGGTWLGCRASDGLLVVGVLNRRPADGTAVGVRGQRSRGLLALDALRAWSLSDALSLVMAEDASRYAPFNLLLADPERAVVIDNGDGGLRVTELEAGLTLLTNLDANDPRCPRLASALPAFERIPDGIGETPSESAIVGACAKVLAGHDNSVDPSGRDPLARLCVHTEAYGTRSASIIVCSNAGDVSYYHSAGPPCRTPFEPVVPRKAARVTRDQ